MSTKNTATFAYFPGSGPAGKVCGQCRHLRQKHSDKGTEMKGKFFCDKARAFINVTYETKAIPRDAAACKYFEEKATVAA
jgi:hypothetical protein